MKITIRAECPVCGWKGKTIDGICPDCLCCLVVTEAKAGEK